MSQTLQVLNDLEESGYKIDIEKNFHPWRRRAKEIIGLTFGQEVAEKFYEASSDLNCEQR
jgi:hypothetical protein